MNSHPLYAAVQQSAAADQGYRFTGFAETVAAFLKTYIDTPEERAKARDAALAAFDAFIAPRIGAIAATALRPLVSTLIDNALAALGS